MHLREVNKKIEILLMELEEIINSENSKEGKEKLNLFIEKRKKIYRFLSNQKLHLFSSCTKKVKSYLRTTNYMERCFKKLKDYIRIKGFFQNEVSAEKFLYLFFNDKNSRLSSRSLRFSFLP